MNLLVDWLIGWPERVARHLSWLAPLFARVVVGWVFLWSGWGKLNNLPQVTENFVGWNIPFPHLLSPFVSGVEFFGGLFLLRFLELRSQVIGVLTGVELGLACKNAGLTPGLVHLCLKGIDGLAVGFAGNRGSLMDLGNLVHQLLTRGG